MSQIHVARFANFIITLVAFEKTGKREQLIELGLGAVARSQDVARRPTTNCTNITLHSLFQISFQLLVTISATFISFANGNDFLANSILFQKRSNT
jgi:hypothetical protein